MLLKYFYDRRLAQASYMVGCPDCGEALVIDPAREIAPYLEAARAEGLTITHVAETHIHADYVSGGRELAAATGATLCLSGHGEGPLAYDFSDAGVNIRLMRDGDVINVGGVKVETLFTPGHTPEHLSFRVTDTGADQPIGLFTGDCLFVGSVGRPDLLDATGSATGTSAIGARQQFEQVRRFKSMPDYLQVWPGHGAGSACGKGMSAIPSSTLGYEKLFNPAFQFDNAESFSAWLLGDQPEAPRYFAQMKRVNRIGAALLGDLDAPGRMPDGELITTAKQALVIDTRPAEDFRAHHLAGTLHIPGGHNSFNTWAGWYIDYARPTYVIAAEPDLPSVVAALRAIGVDDLPGWFTPDAVAAAPGASITAIDPAEAAESAQAGAVMIDVRGADERRQRRIPGSIWLPMGEIGERLRDVPRDRALIVQCGSGVRSLIVASLLEAHGFSDIVNLAGGIDAWAKADLPLERGAEAQPAG
jgi:hydroxyacylglutathione hydrolase